MKYFRITFDQEAPTGLARQPRGMELLEAGRHRTLPLTLDAEPVDFQPNFLFWPLCSPRLRDILDGSKSPADAIDWIPVKLATPRGPLEYFRLESPPKPELLHPSSIIAGGKVIVKPVLDMDRVKAHHVFMLSPDGYLVVTAAVRKAIQATKCTGLVFMNVLVALRQ